MRWLRLLGYIVAFLGTIWTSGKAILDWLGRFDFVIAHRPDLGWIGGAVDYLAAPPLVVALVRALARLGNRLVRSPMENQQDC